MAAAVVLERLKLPPMQAGVALEGMLKPLGVGTPGLRQAAKHRFEPL
jgi:hypothetical protein